MIHACTLNAARPSRVVRRIETFEGHITDFIGTFEKRAPGPQAFLVEQDPLWVTPPHFHVENQFQLVVGGAGAIGRHAVAPYTVHYAARETGYGPITAGPEGIVYLTLRAEGDTGAWYLHKPGVRERMQPGLRREQHHGTPSSHARPDELLRLQTASAETLIAPRADGLAAWMLRVPPHHPVSLPPQPAHGGRHVVVTAGSALFDGRNLDALSVAFITHDDPTLPTSGAGGAEIIVMQFPVNSTSLETPQ
jgi:hypothetical protein